MISQHPSLVDDRTFASLVAEMFDRLRADPAIDIAALIAQHPQHAERLEQLLPTMLRLADFGEVQSEEQTSTGGARDLQPVCGRLGDFEIIRELGRGGMGIVYEARQISLNRRVALKVLPFAGILDEQTLKRFKNEALAAATLDHPHIVGIYFVGCDRGVHYYAMRLIEGLTVAELIAELRNSANLASGPATDERSANASPPHTDAPATVDWAHADTRRSAQAFLSTVRTGDRRQHFRRVAELGIQAAEALEHAHQNGILHRDIKPGNLLVDGLGQLWVTDFGLARIEAEAGVTMTGDVLGTLRYMPPESAAGGSKRSIVDQRSDIYSLGATLYELLTLHPVFAVQDRKELFHAILFTTPREPRSISRDIPVNLETIVLKAMSKDAGERYATAAELASDLKRFINNQPIVAKPPTIVQRTRLWSRRNRLFVMGAAVLLIVVSVSSVIVAANSLRIRRLAARERAALRSERELVKANIALLSEDLASNVLLNAVNVAPEIPAEAIEFYHRALTARQLLMNENPGSKDYLIDVAAMRTTFGVLLFKRGHFDRASGELLEALEVIRSVDGATDFGSTHMAAGTENDLRRTACGVLRLAGRLDLALPFARPLGMTVGDDGLLYVSSRGLDSILRVRLLDGELVDELRLPNGVLSPHGLALGSNGSLYVSSEFQGRIRRFDCATGKFVGDFASGVPNPVGLAFKPRSELYVACYTSNEIRCYDTSSGRLLSTITAGASDRLSGPVGLTLGSTNDLYVTCSTTDRVERYSSNGEFVGVFASGGGLKEPQYLAFASSGELYVVGAHSNKVHRYDGITGSFLGLVRHEGELNMPIGLAFAPSGKLIVNSRIGAILVELDLKTGKSRPLITGPDNKTLCTFWAIPPRPAISDQEPKY